MHKSNYKVYILLVQHSLGIKPKIFLLQVPCSAGMCKTVVLFMCRPICVFVVYIIILFLCVSVIFCVLFECSLYVCGCVSHSAADSN